MPLVMREVPDVHLVILGEGELRVPLERQVKELRLERTVRMPGFREDVLSLIKSADLFVMSSITEGLGSAVLDAMAMGLPVVGTRAGGIPEAVVDGETGLLVPPRDPAALAEAMARVASDPEARRRMGAAGRLRVVEHYSLDRMTRDYERLYLEMVRPG